MEKGLFTRVLILGIGSVLSKFTVFFLMPLYTAALTPASFGVVDVLLGTAALLTPVLAFGAPEAVFRFVAGGESEREVLRAARKLLAFGFAAFSLLFPLLFFFGTVRPFLSYLFFYVLASVLHGFLAHLVRARGRYGFYAVQQVFCTLMTTLLAYYFLIVRGSDVKGYLLAILLSDAITGLLILLFLSLERSGQGHASGQAVFSPMLRFALPLIPTAALWWLIGGVQRYLLLFFRGESATGLYGAAVRIPALLTFASGLFLEAWNFSAIRTERARRAERFGQIYGLLLPVLLFSAMTLILLSPRFVGRFLAEDFGAVSALVPVLSLAALFGALAQFLNSVYSVSLRSGTVLLSSLVGAGVSVGAGLLLIPTFGVEGAAWSSVLAHFSLVLVRALLARRALRFPQHAVQFSLSVGVLLLAVRLAGRGSAALLFLPALLPFVREMISGARLMLDFFGSALEGLKTKRKTRNIAKNRENIAKKAK